MKNKCFVSYSIYQMLLVPLEWRRLISMNVNMLHINFQPKQLWIADEKLKCLIHGFADFLLRLILPSFISRSFSALIRSSRTDAGSSLGSWGTSFPCIARSSIFWRNAFVSIVIFLFVIVQFWLHNYYSCSSSFFNSSFSSNSSIHSFTLACNKALLGR